MIQGFHFLRPEWLWGFLVFLLLPFFLKQSSANTGLWQKICDKFLLQSQTISGSASRSFFPFFLISMCWAIGLLSLAGPAWEKLPQPAIQKGQDNVFVLDISSLMGAKDIKPSRIERARFKIHDVLNKRSDGQTALILYDSSPFVAIPLTSDKKVIENILPTIDAGMMGNSLPNLNQALQKASEILTQSNSTQGQVIVLTGFVKESEVSSISKTAENIKNQGHSVSVLGIGSNKKEPLQRADGSFFLENGKAVFSTLNERALTQIASHGGGVYQEISLNPSDVEKILTSATQREISLEADDLTKTEFKADTWKDFGAISCTFILPFALLGFRKGWLFILMLILCSPHKAQAWSLSDLWTRADRKEALNIQAGEIPTDIEVFENNPEWLGAASYKAKAYETSVQALANPTNTEMLYNQGNALAQKGQYQAAIQAYEKVLKEDATHADALFNKKYLEEQLKNNQQQQNQNQNQDQNQEDKQDKSQENKQQDQEKNQENQDKEKQSQQQQQQQNQSQAQKEKKQEEEGKENQAQQQQQSQGGEQQPSEEKAQKKDAEQEQQGANPDEKTKEEKEKQEQLQWLSVIEDNPSGLLRERIRRHNIRNQRRQ